MYIHFFVYLDLSMIPSHYISTQDTLDNHNDDTARTGSGNGGSDYVPGSGRRSLVGARGGLASETGGASTKVTDSYQTRFRDVTAKRRKPGTARDGPGDQDGVRSHGNSDVSDDGEDSHMISRV